MHVRPATLDDSSNILAWRNDELTRRMSRETALVDVGQHGSWFAQAISRPGSVILIAESATAKVGMVRFDLSVQSTWEVSINLNPAERGKGLSAHVLELALAYMEQRFPDPVFGAHIKAQNAASETIFERCGFKVVEGEKEEGWLEMRR